MTDLKCEKSQLNIVFSQNSSTEIIYHKVFCEASPIVLKDGEKHELICILSHLSDIQYRRKNEKLLSSS